MIQPEGNYYDKYHSANPIVKWMMTNFFDKLHALLAETENVSSILEAGCGEGEVTNYLRQYFGNTCEIDAFDVSEKVIADAKENYPSIHFYTDNIYDLSAESGYYDLVVCSEVMEHLEYPEKALRQISRVAARYIILSVPHEPIWRILNMCRGRYINDFGNTPGHIQHWTASGFVEFLRHSGMNVSKIVNPLPWTMVFIKK